MLEFISVSEEKDNITIYYELDNQVKEIHTTWKEILENLIKD